MAAKDLFEGQRLSLGGDDDGDGAITLYESRSPVSRQATALGFYALVAALCIWLFAYVSGLYPYLGSAATDNRSSFGQTTSFSESGFGVETMLLFAGQTAFFEYESTSAESDITLDVKPMMTLGYSPAMQRIRGVAKGTAEFPVATTGLYNFRHEPALGRRYGRTAYSVSWGAR